MVSRRK